MKNYKRNVLIAFASLLIVIIGTVTVYGASNVSTVVQAYKGVKIVYNGITLTADSDPYIINNTTYVPIRMLMNQFGKDISWDATNQQVIINNSAAEVDKDKQIESLKNQITALNAKINGLETALNNANTTIRTIDDAVDTYNKNNNSSSSSSTGTSGNSSSSSGTNSTDATLIDFQTNLNKFFKDAGEDYFDDDGIVFNIGLSGNTTEIVYNLTLDFSDADDYNKLTKVSQSKIKSLLNIVKSKIGSEIYGTSYEDANITGKLSDRDNTSSYVKYNGSTYSFSWDESDDVLSDTSDYLQKYFKNKGNTYFKDDGITFEFKLSGDEDDIAYKIYINFDDADEYDHLNDVSSSYVRTFLDKVKSVIESEIDGTDYEDADITGYLYDDGKSSYYVKYNGSKYTFSY